MKGCVFIKQANLVCVLLSLFSGVACAVEGGEPAKGSAGVSAEQSQTSDVNKNQAPTIFATVDDVSITQEDYDIELTVAARKKFYHGRAPVGELAVLQREVGDRLVNNVLLVKEAKRRNIHPKDDIVKTKLEQIEKRNKELGDWEKRREKYLPRIVKSLEEESVLSQIEESVRKISSPTDEQLMEFYKKNPDKFTQPQQVRVSIILLKVDPGAPGKTWVDTFAKMRELHKKLKDGADFAQMAKEHSGDFTAESGGDMGVLHGGMLPEMAQSEIDKLKVGEFSDPIRLLEGIAVFKLQERYPAKLSEFDVVKVRAASLWTQDESDKAWLSLIAKLRASAKIHVDESRYEALPVAENTDNSASGGAGSTQSASSEQPPVAQK